MIRSRLTTERARFAGLRLAIAFGVLLAVAAQGREPTEQEQYFVELINRARLDPEAEVIRLGTGDLNEGPPTLGPDSWTIVPEPGHRAPSGSRPSWSPGARAPSSRPEGLILQPASA